MFSTVATLAIMISFFMLFTVMNQAMAQAPYLKTMNVTVASGTNATASAYCEDGDGMISGGYSIGLYSSKSAFDTMVYSNHPIQEINKTGYFEGWETGLVNRGNTSAHITASVLCLNLTLTS